MPPWGHYRAAARRGSWTLATDRGAGAGKGARRPATDLGCLEGGDLAAVTVHVEAAVTARRGGRGDAGTIHPGTGHETAVLHGQPVEHALLIPHHHVIAQPHRRG